MCLCNGRPDVAILHFDLRTVIAFTAAHQTSSVRQDNTPKVSSMDMPPTRPESEFWPNT